MMYVCQYAFSWNLFVLHFGAPLPKNRCCPKVIEVPHQDESFSSQINPSHFKCLIGGAPSTLWIASSPRYTFLLGIPYSNRITFQWNPGRGTPKSCQESNPQKLTDDGSVVFCCPFKPKSHRHRYVVSEKKFYFSRNQSSFAIIWHETPTILAT